MPDVIQPSSSHPLNLSLHPPPPLCPDTSSPWRWWTGNAPRGMTGTTTAHRGTMRATDPPKTWTKTSVSRWERQKKRPMCHPPDCTRYHLASWKFDQNWSGVVAVKVASTILNILHFVKLFQMKLTDLLGEITLSLQVFFLQSHQSRNSYDLKISCMRDIERRCCIQPHFVFKSILTNPLSHLTNYGGAYKSLSRSQPGFSRILAATNICETAHSADKCLHISDQSCKCDIQKHPV